MPRARHSGTWARWVLFYGALLVTMSLFSPAQVANAAPDDPTPGHTFGGETEKPEPGELSEESLQALLDRLQELYQKAEKTTEDYNAAKEKLGRQRKAVRKLESELDQQHAEVHRGRRDAGALARRQYIDGGLSAYGRLLLSEDPYHALQRGHMLDRTARSQAEVVSRLEAGERNLDRLAKKNRQARDSAATTATRQRTAKIKVTRQLRDVERLLSSLTGAQAKELKALEKRGIDAAQAAFLRSGVLGKGGLPPSALGRKAIAYALHHLGDPYGWGAEGPDTFDCSGLTYQAWLRAGQAIPRTSQEQWKRLPRTPLDRIRPGDLVIYFPDATHVGLYLGGGRIVHAPRPGTRITMAPVGSMPVLGAVRPDPAAQSVGRYQSPTPPARSDTASQPLANDRPHNARPRLTVAKSGKKATQVEEGNRTDHTNARANRAPAKGRAPDPTHSIAGVPPSPGRRSR